MTIEQADEAKQHAKRSLIATAQKLSDAGIALDILYAYSETKDSKRYDVLLLRVTQKSLCKMEFDLRVQRCTYV